MKRFTLLPCVVVLAALALLPGCGPKDPKTPAAPAAGPAPQPPAQSLTETVFIRSEADIVGLWSGHFDSTEVQKGLEKLLHEWYEQGDYFGEDGLSKKQLGMLSKEQLKWIETDALYGGKVMTPPNAISLVIDEMRDGKVKGRSVCAGNDRPLTGSYTTTSTGWQLTLAEPGDDPYDGTFVVQVSKNSKHIDGSWQPFKPTVAAKTFWISRKNFTYNPDYQWVEASWRFLKKGQKMPENLNASARKLTAQDVENQPKSVLRLARNEIYARHGYSFKQRDIRNYFERFDEYVPVHADIRNLLTPLEKENEALLKRYEDYAEEFYDQYGR